MTWCRICYKPLNQWWPISAMQLYTALGGISWYCLYEVRVVMWDEITYPCPSFNNGLAKTPSPSDIDIKTNNDDAGWHTLYPYHLRMIIHENNYFPWFTRVAMLYRISHDLCVKNVKIVLQYKEKFRNRCCRLYPISLPPYIADL